MDEMVNLVVNYSGKGGILKNFVKMFLKDGDKK